MKICLVGPSYPFRGGISHYTTLLYRNLKKKHELKLYAFKRQYPNWLFPGKTDKDPSKFFIADTEIELCLDSMNPVTWLEIFFKVKKFNPDLVIFPWWVAFWTPQFGTISLLIKKFTKTKILFICHNVVEHEANNLTRFLTKIVLRNGDFFIVHSEDDSRNLRNIIPDAKVLKTHHPTYKVFKQNGWDREKARQTLGIGTSKNIILFFGFVRKYKGLQYLIEALPLILKHINLTLLIVGEFWKDKSNYVEQIKRLTIEDKVKIIDKYVPNEEVGLYFAACDVVVVPYISATGSGIVQLAFGCEKPVITTRVGSLSEVVKHGKTGYLIKPSDTGSIVNAVFDFYRQEKEKEFVGNIKNESARFSWEKLVKAIENLTKRHFS